MGKNISTGTKVMLGSAVGLLGTCSGVSAGASAGTPEMAGMLLAMFCMVFIPLCAGGLVLDFTKNKQLKTTMLARRNSLTQIAHKYNQVTELLKTSYKYEKGQLGLFDKASKEALRIKFEEKYNQNKAAFEKERRAYLASSNAQTPTQARFKTFWKWVIALGLITQMTTCGYTVGSLPTDDAQVVTAVSQGTGTLWNADNLPMPHLQDASRYVANPDNVVSANTEMLLNQWFKRLDDSLGIESIVAIVDHVENDDPFRMAQDLGNKYGVGKDDRGLIIILAYGDHALHFSTGKSLEGDLTDIECKRLQQEYAVPCMKAEQPDSGMLYLAEAIYNTLQKKELPVLTARSANADDDEFDISALYMMIYMLLFGGWAILIGFLNHRYNGPSGRYLFHANPFMKQPTGAAFVSGGGGGFRGGGFRSGGGGGFSGGSFGGVSFGGGGATSRW